VSRKICVVTGSRADYGLLRWVMEGIRQRPAIALQLVATGMHLSPTFGSTYREIEADGFTIDARVDMELESDSATGIAHSMGAGVSGMAKAFESLAPDIVVLLGDRFEMLSASVAATVSRIPMAHLHGGETTEGAFDEGIRHAITKLAHLHFVAAEEYRRRVIQLGEQPERVFLVGGLGIDSIRRLPLLDRKPLESELGVELGPKSLMVTFHPATLEKSSAARQMRELLAALDALEDTTLIFTMTNADPEGRGLFDVVTEFVSTHPRARAFTSLGQLRYLSCIAQVDGVVGNSSSGLIEVPAFQKGTVNIGDRQRGRLKAASVIDCAPDRAAITGAIATLYSPAFQQSLASVKNPYGEGGASDRIVQILAEHPLDGLLKKPFHDLPL
jgi:GDP/UDP-N,N'-diacetylbacillosamine 2-epimerase (hydrolysing)